jgi:hypothetical protein
MGRAQSDLLAAERSTRSLRPVLALDIDGVVFPLPEKPFSGELPTYPGWVQTNIANLPVSYDPELVAWLQGVQKEGVEVIWASDWGESALRVAGVLGLDLIPALDVSQGRYETVSSYAQGRVLAWCEDRPQNASVKASLRARVPPALLVQPKRHLGLTAKQRARISKWLVDNST